MYRKLKILVTFSSFVTRGSPIGFWGPGFGLFDDRDSGKRKRDSGLCSYERDTGFSGFTM